MTKPLTMGSLKAILLFPFQEPAWRGRFLIGAALFLAGHIVPVLPLIPVVGYSLHILRRAALGDDPEMPAWGEWGRFTVDGLRGMLVALVYLLPGIVVLAGGMGLYFASSLAPFASETDMAYSWYGHEDVWITVFLAGMAILLLSMFLGAALLAVAAVPLPVAMTHFSVQEKVSAAFRPREWWPMVRTNAAGYFAVWVVAMGLTAMIYIAQLLVGYSIILCCLVPFVSAAGGFYLSLIFAALFGQFYREGSAVSVAQDPPLLFDEDAR